MLGAAEVDRRLVYAYTRNSYCFFQIAIAVLVLIEIDLDHEVIKLHWDPVVEMAERAFRSVLCGDAGRLVFTHVRSNAPRMVPDAFPGIRGDLEATAIDFDVALIISDLGEARRVFGEPIADASNHRRLFLGMDETLEGQIKI